MRHEQQQPFLRRCSPWKKPILVFLYFAALFCTSPSWLFAATPLGLWYAEGGAAQVEISQCEHTLCGRVVWLRSPLADTGCPLQDQHNPDPGLRHRSVLGLVVLQGLTPDVNLHGEWSGGTIYDPSNGKTYACHLRMDGDHRLQLRGYVGVPLLGRTTTWIRVGTEGQPCQSASASQEEPQ